MARPQQKAAKLGRNDPCHCGSGKKYKDCHLPIEQEARTEQLRLRQAQDTLLPRIIAAAQDQPELLPAAFERFWQGKYQLDQSEALDQSEDRGAERFLTWLAFDVRRPEGTTLVEGLAADEAFAADPYERRLLAAWHGVRLRPYLVAEVRKGQGVTVRDLLEGDEREVADYGASRRLAAGEVVVGHLVPADTAPGAAAPTYYLAGAAAQLTDDTAAKLVEFAELHLADLRRSDPEAAWPDLVAQRSEIFNHFVSALPTEARDPGLLDRIVREGRLALQLTAESVADLLGRPAPAPTDPGAARDEADPAAPPPQGEQGGGRRPEPEA
ncbi:MAG TPA: SEC-C domain-containing protein [Chloroflexaceae bacterium]|nr:SEC-C domain-containing protein [Chloroflexaceae bacterium]